MKIGIISDTHRKFKKAKRAVDTLLEDGAEFLIHAGDIVELETLELLRDSKCRYIAVYGNNDMHLREYHKEFNLVDEPYSFKLADTTFKLMHIPYYLNGDVDIVIFGHTHRAIVEHNGKTLFLNSGEVCARDSGISRWSMLEVDQNHFLVTQYARENRSDIIERVEHNFIRSRYE